MKVYVITGGYNYEEDPYVLGVAKTKDEANKIAKEKKYNLNWISIDKWEYGKFYLK